MSAFAAPRDVLRYATLGLDTSDPHRHTGSIAVQQCYVEPLTSIADDGQVKPFLAEKIDVSADGRIYTIRVREGVRFAMLVNVVLGLATFTAIYFFGDTMMLAFTNDPEVIAIGQEYLLIIGGFFIVHGGLNVFNGALRGAGDTLFTMVVSLTCLWLIRIPLAYWFSSIWGRVGIWWAIGASLCIGLAVTYIYYRLGFWKNKGAVREGTSE